MTQKHTKGRLIINCLTGFYFLFDVFCVCVYREKHLLIAVPRVVTGEEIGITAPLPLPPSSSFFSSSTLSFSSSLSSSHSSLVRPPLLLLLHLPFLLLLLPFFPLRPLFGSSSSSSSRRHSLLIFFRTFSSAAVEGEENLAQTPVKQTDRRRFSRGRKKVRRHKTPIDLGLKIDPIT